MCQPLFHPQNSIEFFVYLCHNKDVIKKNTYTEYFKRRSVIWIFQVSVLRFFSVNSSDPGSLANAVSIKMLDNAISSNESLGVGLAKMMENSVYPNLGSNIDVSV